MQHTIDTLAVIQEDIGIDGRSKVVSEAVRTLADDTTSIDLLTLANEDNFERFVSNYELSDYTIHHRQYLNTLPNPPGMTYKAVVLNYLVRRDLANYDLVFNSNNCLRFLSDGSSIISYVHAPLPAIPEIDTRYHNSLLMSAYAFPMQIYHRISNPLQFENHLIVTNSQFIADKYEDVFNRPADDVLYPPCVETASEWVPTGSGVVTLGRFHPQKRQRTQLEVAARLPELEFTLMGRVEPGRSEKYYEKCARFVKRRGLDNVELIPNASRDEISRVLKESLVFLHSMKSEHFGISIVEGIRAGCVPVVHDSGGPKEIVPIPDLRYKSVEEGAPIIEDCVRTRGVEFGDQLSRQLSRFTHRQFRESLRQEVIDGFNVFLNESSPK